MFGQITLRPDESKRLIAKGVAATRSVREAFANHTIILAGGTTNSYIAEELLGIEFEQSTDYTIGLITDGKMGLSPEDRRMPPFVISKGKAKDADYHWKTYLEEIKHGDVFIKGGNAVDHTGLAGVFASNEKGGTIGAAWGTILQRGVELIVPIGLEKLIPDVRLAVELTARNPMDRTMGDRVALMPLLGGRSFTEIDALKTLYNLKASCIGAGGVNNTEGSVSLAIEGQESDIDKVFALIESYR